MVTAKGKNLIFLVSAPRSGSTLLGAMLGSAPGLICPPETWVQLLLPGTKQSAAKIRAPFDYRLAFDAFAEALPASERQDAWRSFVASFYNRILKANDGTTFVDKTPRYYHILKELAELWPEARFVWIQRNPLDVVASCKDTWRIPVSEQLGEVVSPHTYDATVSFAKLLDFFGRPAKNRTAVRYEDIVRDPEATLKQLCHSLGLKFSPMMLTYGENTSLVSRYKASSFGDKKIHEHTAPHNQSIGRWRNLLGKEEIRGLITTLGATCFIQQGYEAELKDACAVAGLARAKVPARGTMETSTVDATESPRQTIPTATEVPVSLLRNDLTAALNVVDELRAQIEALQNERNLLQAQFADLQKNFTATEADRITRGDVIERQGREQSVLHAEMDARLKELHGVYAQLEALKNERNLLRAQHADLQRNFATVEADCSTRGEVIERQGREHTALQAEFDLRLKELNALYPQFEALKNDRNLLQARFADLQKNFNALEADRHTRGAVIERQGREHTALQAEFDLRLKELNALYPQFEALKNDRNLLQARFADLQKNFAAVEADRTTRGAVIERQGREHTALQTEFDRRLTELNALYYQHETLKNERNLLRAQLADLQRNFDLAEQDRIVRGKVIEQQGREGDEVRRIAYVTEVDRDAWRGHYEKVHAALEATKAKLAETEAAYSALEARLKNTPTG